MDMKMDPKGWEKSDYHYLRWGSPENSTKPAYLVAQWYAKDLGPFP